MARYLLKGNGSGVKHRYVFITLLHVSMFSMFCIQPNLNLSHLDSLALTVAPPVTLISRHPRVFESTRSIPSSGTPVVRLSSMSSIHNQCHGPGLPPLTSQLTHGSPVRHVHFLCKSNASPTRVYPSMNSRLRRTSGLLAHPRTQPTFVSLSRITTRDSLLPSLRYTHVLARALRCTSNSSSRRTRTLTPTHFQLCYT